MNAAAGPRWALLVSSRRWVHTARLALAVRDAGFTVGLVAPTGHPLERLSWIRSVGSYSALRPCRTVSHALNTSGAEIVIPADDAAADTVFRAYANGLLEPDAMRTVQRSLGDPTTFSVRHRRSQISAIAAASGLAGPRTYDVASLAELDDVVELSDLPAVVKTDRSFGGQEVIVVNDRDSARAAYRRLARPPAIHSSVGRLIRDDEPNYLVDSFARVQPRVSVQGFVAGEPATLTAASWRGEVLGIVAVRVLRSVAANGPATVVEPVDHPDMVRAADIMAKKLGLSGLFGLDFIVSADGRAASLIELNPRATPTAHLFVPTLMSPLLHLLAECVELRPPDPPDPLPAGPVALFPQAHLYHPDIDVYGSSDMPQHAPDVVALCIAPAATALPPWHERLARHAVRSR